ncbi:FAD-dependent monooxygenase [Streptomyces bottropensis]|uniref:FAD-dependent monooxygenase n=1 Tax=Streptomyces bottropensis TaxID=42235 RepID=UPI0036AC7900
MTVCLRQTVLVAPHVCLTTVFTAHGVQMPNDCEVIVVGVEREPEMWSQARGVHFDGETMCSLQAIGLAEDVAALSKPVCDFRVEKEAGETLITQPTGQWGSQAWHDEVLFRRPEIDALLRTEVSRLPGVELRCGVTLVGIEEDADAVRCHVRTQDGADGVLTARWVTACDDAQSTVRRALGVACENLGTDDPPHSPRRPRPRSGTDRPLRTAPHPAPAA